MKYKIGKTPNIRAGHNKETWDKLESKLAKVGSATIDQIVDWCEGHKHPSGGKGFVKYCINNDWLVQSDRNIDAHPEPLKKNQ